ncbi:hypothetical protein ACVZD1_27150, partial [Pseudomonas aeruginosa]
MWFLGKMGFTNGSSHYRYEGFEGKVLEVGSGPIGFFEKVEGVTGCSGQPIPDSGLSFSSATAGGNPSLN